MQCERLWMRGKYWDLRQAITSAHIQRDRLYCQIFIYQNIWPGNDKNVMLWQKKRIYFDFSCRQQIFQHI